MSKVFNVFILVVLLSTLHTEAQSSCSNNNRKCNSVVIDNFYTLRHTGTNCTNSTHVAVHFSYNISSYLRPKGIRVALDGNGGNLELSIQDFDDILLQDNGALFVAKKSWLKSSEPLDLALRFASLLPDCKNTRFGSSKHVLNMAICKKLNKALSCPDPPTTNVISTESNDDNLKAATTINSRSNVTAHANDNLHVIIIVVLFITFAGFGLVGMAILRVIIRRNRFKTKNVGETAINENEFLEDGIIITLKKQTNVPIKLFLVFVIDHQKHLNVIKNFASFLLGDLGFQVSCEIFQTLEYSQDPVAWMDKCFNEADKVLIIWSHKAVSRWVQYNDEKSGYQDLFTPVLKHVYNDMFRHRNRGKYYFGFFDYFSKENIPNDFINETNFRLMNQFEDLYYRLKSIEPYVPGGEIKEERVSFDHYSSSQYNRYGKELQRAIREMNSFVQNNPDWYDQRVCTSSSVLDSNGQAEINCNVLHIQPPPPSVTGQNCFEVNVSTTNPALNDSMNKGLLISDSSTAPTNSRSPLQHKDIVSQRQDDSTNQAVDEHGEVDIATSAVNNHLNNNQTSSNLEHESFVQILEEQLTPLDSGVHSFVDTFSAVMAPKMKLKKSQSFIKPVLPPIDLRNDPMRSLLTVNQSFRNNEMGLKSLPESPVSKKKTYSVSATVSDTARANLTPKRYSSNQKVNLTPIDFDSDPMSTLIALNCISKNEKGILRI